MKVSIIVPIYNTAPYLDRCIASLVGQTHTDLQILLVNDGSTDSSEAVCRRWLQQDGRLQLICQPQQGLSAARNAGIDAATGEYICFVDSDDCVLPGYVQTLLALCLEQNVPLAVCGYALNDEYALPHQVALPAEQPATEVIDRRDFFHRLNTGTMVMYVAAWNKLYHRSIWQQLRYDVGKLHEDEGVIHLVVDQCPRIAVSGTPLYLYTQRAGSIMGQKAFRPAQMDALAFLRRRADYLAAQGWHDLVFLTLKDTLVRTLQLYNRIDAATPDGGRYRRQLMAQYRTVYARALRCPVRSLRFLARMALYGLHPTGFAGVDGHKFLYG